MSATGTITRVDFDQKVSERLDDVGRHDDFAGWFCVQTVPFPCPADGCTFVAYYMTAAHLILVWPENDDPKLLHHAGLAKLAGRDPRVVEYEPGFGPCITFDRWRQIGKPIHAQIDKPDGWPT